MIACARRALACSTGSEHDFFVVVFPRCIPVAVDTIVPCVLLFCEAYTAYMA